MEYVRLAAVLFIWFRATSIFKMYENTRFTLEMVMQAIQGMSGFMAILMFGLLFFAIAFFTLNEIRFYNLKADI
jgi:hypothetical protein